jgi:hypothetical protein
MIMVKVAVNKEYALYAFKDAVSMLFVLFELYEFVVIM